MASSGNLEVEVEVKSHSDKFWPTIRDSPIILPKAFPNDYKSIEILEGDGKSVGTIRLITYGEGSPLVKVSKEKIEAFDEGKKTLSYSVIEGDLLAYYKVFKCHITVTPKGAGSLAKWSCEFQKASEEIPDPHIIKDFVVKNFKELDDYVLHA
ncbi:MLP-like protein 423 [Corylus avellana]|uniref:MLP-like protein 423 n=1 Tax=Corylus avellana TaxID=13451 RepID=UPI001E208A4E|nr:MLP-like protein 423 [Corylus avellana]